MDPERGVQNYTGRADTFRRPEDASFGADRLYRVLTPPTCISLKCEDAAKTAYRESCKIRKAPRATTKNIKLPMIRSGSFESVR